MDMVRQLKERVETKTRVALDFAARETWDLFLVSFSDAHDAGHICWHLHDPNHPRHDAALVAEIGDPVKAIYMAIDTALGRLLEAMDETVTVLVFSGIGMGPNYSGNFLLDQFLRLREFGATPPTRRRQRLQRNRKSTGRSAVARDYYRIADGDEDNGFIHVVLRIAHGRSLDVQKAAGDEIFEALRKFLQPTYANGPLAISFEMQEINPKLRWKQNNLREYLDRRAGQ